MYRKQQKYVMGRELDQKNYRNKVQKTKNKSQTFKSEKKDVQDYHDTKNIIGDELIYNIKELMRINSHPSLQINNLNVDNINQRVRDAQYAVRGELVTIADQMQRDISSGKRSDFEKVVFCNIGNPHAVGQKPITFIRQVLSLVEYPELLENPNVTLLYPKDVIERAKEYVIGSRNGVGAYSNSQGFDFVVRDVANFIEARDGYKADLKNIFLTNGASEGIQMFLNTIIRNNMDGVLLPIPQYPLYSALLTLLGGTKVNYYLDEEKGWGLSIQELNSAVTKAKMKGINVRSIVVINPGNPTGHCLEVDNMKEIIKFCHRENLIIIADEVYQENVYTEGKKFTSFRKVLLDMGEEYRDVQLFSCHSVSKGFLGECGQRGGYFEINNIDGEVRDQIYKLACTRLCPNTLGQLVVSMMTRPPKEGEPSYELYERERNAILSNLKERSILLTKELNAIPGITCERPQGAMYIFPRVELPTKFIEEAERLGKKPDFLWAKYMLEEAGVCVIPGSGFGQKQNTFHFRTTFLADQDTLKDATQRMRVVHERLLKEFS
ncbi:alanine aminotransferase 2 [Neocallimastix lanati (nom. inval.)]|nr:alanine aminotransferase 2 [Neocallimastix sp. JGI-2020a]